jgi:hypothetical protein
MDKWESRINVVGALAMGLMVGPILLWFELYTLVVMSMFVGMGLLSLYLMYVSLFKEN